MNRPKPIDYLNCLFFNSSRYASDLEKYCDVLENEVDALCEMLAMYNKSLSAYNDRIHTLSKEDWKEWATQDE